MKHTLQLGVAIVFACANLFGADDPGGGDRTKNSSSLRKTNAGLPVDGEYTLKATHSVGDPLVQFPRSPIPDAAYKPAKNAKPLQLLFSEDGKKVTINVGKAGTGTLEERTATERIYSLDGLFAGGQLRLKRTADGVIGTYTRFGSGRPVIESVRGFVVPAEAAGATPAEDRGSRVRKQPVNLDRIKDKVSVKFGEDSAVNLRSVDGRLQPLATGEKAEANDVILKIAIKETTDTPFKVAGDPTRSYLAMSNGSDHPLRFRALARFKGTKEFYEVEDPLGPVEPGDMSVVRCWESGSLVEEVVLYDFTVIKE